MQVIDVGEFRFAMLMLSILSTIGIYYLLILVYTGITKNATCKCNGDIRPLDDYAYCRSCGKFKGKINNYYETN